MCRKLGPNCGYPQFRVIFAPKLGWCWVVGVNLPKLGSNNPNFTPISPTNCGKIGVKLVLWLGLGVVFSHIDWVGVVVGGVKTSFCTSLVGLWLWMSLAIIQANDKYKINFLGVLKGLRTLHFRSRQCGMWRKLLISYVRICWNFGLCLILVLFPFDWLGPKLFGFQESVAK